MPQNIFLHSSDPHLIVLLVPRKSLQFSKIQKLPPRNYKETPNNSKGPPPQKKNQEKYAPKHIFTQFWPLLNFTIDSSKGRVKKSGQGAHFYVDRLMWCFFTYFLMLTKNFLWFLNALQAHCNPTLFYLYMKICIIVQLNYHLGLISQKSQ